MERVQDRDAGPSTHGWLGLKDAGKYVELFAKRSGPLLLVEWYVALETSPFFVSKTKEPKIIPAS